MRRKKLLLLVVIFVVSGSAIMQILKRIAIDSPKEDTAYIRIEEWGMPDEVEIPRTGETDAEMSVPTPNEVASLSVRSVNAKQLNATIQDELSFKPEVVRGSYNLTFWDILNNAVWFLLGVGVLVLGCYLTYQHFMR